MNLATFIVAALVFTPVGFVLYHKFKQMKNGDTGCSCGCSGCSHSKSCGTEKDIQK